MTLAISVKRDQHIYIEDFGHLGYQMYAKVPKSYFICDSFSSQNNTWCGYYGSQRVTIADTLRHCH
jgi:hypothetical protein